MARKGPGDDFHNQPTQHADYGKGGQPQPGGPPPDPTDRFQQPESGDYFDQDAEPTPWYRRPVLLIGWIVFVLILIALIIYGIIELIHGDQGTSRTPSTTSTTSTTTTTTPPTTTTTSTTPPTSSAVEPLPQQPTHRPTQQPTHRHHLPELPSVITIPGIPTVITVPPGLR